MSEKLTREEFATIWKSDGVWGPQSMQGCWSRIEADREAIREETRAEVLKDHFKIHETIEARNIDGGWNRLTVTLQPEGMYPEPMEYRRPLKMRPTTRNENERAIHERTGIDWGKPFLGALSESTIRAMASDMGIPTEVPE